MSPTAHRSHDPHPSRSIGWSDGDALVRRILHGSARVLAGISGPGGSGKSTLLERMADELRSGGARVVRDADVPSPSGGDASRPVVVLVDDAEQLSPGEVATIERIIADDVAHLVVAFRPSPGAPVVEALDGAGRRHTTVTLHPLSDAGVSARAGEVLGVVPEDDLASRILEFTGGNPRLVDLALYALRDDDWDLDADRLPSTMLTRITDELDALDRRTRQFALALAVGFSASGPALATAPRFADTDTLSLMQAIRAAGLAHPDGRLAAVVRTAVLRAAMPDEAWSLRRELVDALESAGMPLDEPAMSLAEQGFRDPRIASALERAGDELLAVDATRAVLRYRAAVDAGADRVALEARRAHAAWAAGDVRDAERLVDRFLARPDAADVCRGVAVAAAVWARQGLLRRSADAYERLAGEECALAPLAVFALAATGESARARALRAGGRRIAYPTSSHMAVDLMADGFLQMLDGDADRALGTLLTASSVMSEAGAAIPLPEVPAVLAAQVALSTGELRIADEVLSSAIAAGQGGPAFSARLQLMRSLVALRADRPLHAREHLAAARADAATRPTGLRDELLASAVRVGLARHQGDIPDLVRAWEAARHAIAGMQPDVMTLPALAELVVAAARLGEPHLVAPHLAAAWELLDRVGDAAPLTTGLHWTEIESGLLRNDPAAVRRHAEALEARVGDRTAQRLGHAARVWAAALAGQVVVEAVERAARDLEAAGYPWDASRMAGHAAGRAAEHQDSLRLLALARSLHPDEVRSAGVPSPADRIDAEAGAAPFASRDDSRLSARESEVARLVLEGKTYAEIGQAIFISPRTAEHHIARIRRRLGATNRSDLIAKLRAALESDDSR
ncbi:helix-turn-helix transcriptional regulator [Agromyces sp. C10]|uniref:helix-turn-helix transcriptional regulator n=1 Tax=Agromyces sp. C10 TaxID=2935077 RepID=UPI00200ABAEF|nr:helix-turn-helix transcriptional regulator [Agromyces sp. C10]MCK8610364.1 LuxR C-terminal-related transcriptional regulator [Agromyces sp. C10]